MIGTRLCCPFPQKSLKSQSSSLPIGVSDYVLERFIPADFKSQLPTVEEVEGELTRRMEIAERHLGGMLADGTGVRLAAAER